LNRHIEGNHLLTWEPGNVHINYTARITDPNLMDPIFREALATKLAMELCEEITQSNTKKEGLRADYREIIREARKANAIEKMAAFPPEDTWITGRR